MICERGGNVGVCACGDEEDAEVARVGGGGKTHDGEADEGDEGVDDEDGTADVEFVAEVGGDDHEDGGEGVLWSKCQ